MTALQMDNSSQWCGPAASALQQWSWCLYQPHSAALQPTAPSPGLPYSCWLCTRSNHHSMTFPHSSSSSSSSSSSNWYLQQRVLARQLAISCCLV
jgi:hypothetical protein